MDDVTWAGRDAGEGDLEGMVALIRDTQEQVWRLCAWLVDEQTADDLTQETYLRAFRSLPRFRGDSSPRTWLLSIAHRACMDELRTRTRRRRRDALLLAWRRDESVNSDTTEEVTVNELLARLEPQRRAAFVLTQLYGLSYEQAASACGCPVGTVRSRVARARSDLMALIAPGAGERPNPAARDRSGLRLNAAEP